MVAFGYFHGIVTAINDLGMQNSEDSGCFKFYSINDESGGTVNFVVSPTTYFVNDAMVSVGDRVTGYYDLNAPVPLIYPPQYQALIMVKDNPYENIKIDYFNRELISSDGQLKLHLSNDTEIILRNHQMFYNSPANRNLIVFYGPSTKSIPAQTTPHKIVVWC